MHCRSRMLSSSIRDQGIHSVLQSLSNYTSSQVQFTHFFSVLSQWKSVWVKCLKCKWSCLWFCCVSALPIACSSDRNNPHRTKATGRRGGGVLICPVLPWTTYVSNGIADVLRIMMMTTEIGKGRGGLFSFSDVKWWMRVSWHSARRVQFSNSHVLHVVDTLI